MNERPLSTHSPEDQEPHPLLTEVEQAVGMLECGNAPYQNLMGSQHNLYNIAVQHPFRCVYGCAPKYGAVDQMPGYDKRSV